MPGTAFSAGMTGGSGPSVAPWNYSDLLCFTGLFAVVATVATGRAALTGRPADVMGPPNRPTGGSESATPDRRSRLQLPGKDQ
jgi:hypothetical protein